MGLYVFVYKVGFSTLSLINHTTCNGLRAAHLILGKEGCGWRCPDGCDERADGGVVAHRRRRHRRHEGQVGQRRRHQQERLLAVALQARQT